MPNKLVNVNATKPKYLANIVPTLKMHAAKTMQFGMFDLKMKLKDLGDLAYILKY